MRHTQATIRTMAHIDQLLDAVHSNEWVKAESILADIIGKQPMADFRLVHAQSASKPE